MGHAICKRYKIYLGPAATGSEKKLYRLLHSRTRKTQVVAIPWAVRVVRGTWPPRPWTAVRS